MDVIRIIFSLNGDSEVEMFFPKTIKIEDALIQFLKKTNSLIDLDKILFLNKNKILNDSTNLKKSLFQVFRTNNNRVNVIDEMPILGGGGPVDFCDVSKKKSMKA